MSWAVYEPSTLTICLLFEVKTGIHSRCWALFQLHDFFQRILNVRMRSRLEERLVRYGMPLSVSTVLMSRSQMQSSELHSIALEHLHLVDDDLLLLCQSRSLCRMLLRRLNPLLHLLHILYLLVLRLDRSITLSKQSL